MGTAVEDGIVSKNPCVIKGAGIERAPERPIATIDQVFALADTIVPRYRLAVLLATFGGLRLGELLGLTRRRIDLEAATLEVVEQLQEVVRGGYVVGPPKSDAGRRTVSLPPFMLDETSTDMRRGGRTVGSSKVRAEVRCAGQSCTGPGTTLGCSWGWRIFTSTISVTRVTRLLLQQEQAPKNSCRGWATPAQTLPSGISTPPERGTSELPNV